MKRERQKHIWRWAFTVIALLLVIFSLALVILGSDANNNDIASAILFSISIVIAIFTWLLPFPQESTEQITLLSGNKLLRGNFRMGDEIAANFPYITIPLQNTYNTAIQALIEASSKTNAKHGIVVFGEANSGKTRLILEALIQTLPTWDVLVWNPAYTMSQIPQTTTLHARNIVVFIDDLQEYVPNENRTANGEIIIADNRTVILQGLLDSIRNTAKHVVVIAASRIEDELQVRTHLSQLLNELTLIMLPTFSKNTSDSQTADIISKFRQHGLIHINDWDGTLGSLVLGLNTKNSLYLRICRDYSGTILHSMKLLTLANTTDHTKERIRAICTSVFNEKKLQENTKVWERAIEQLIRLQFITEEETEDSNETVLVIRKDSYFDKVITEYPSTYRPQQLFRDFLQLQHLFRNQKDVEVLFNLGGAFSDLKHYEKAVATYEDIIAINQLDKDYTVYAYINLGVDLYRLHRYEEALNSLDQAIQLDPSFALIKHHKGRVLTELHRYEEALNSFDQAIQLDPSDIDAYNGKGIVLAENLQNYQEALLVFDRAIQLEHINEHIYTNKGNALAGLKRYQEALGAYEQAILLNSQSSETYADKGNVLADLERYEEALASYKQAILLDPRPSFYLAKGNALADLERYEEALASYEQAILLDSTSDSYYFHKADTFIKLERYNEALTVYQEIVRRDPNNSIAYNNMGDLLSQLKRYEEALNALEQAIHLNPNEPSNYLLKGNILSDLNKSNEALVATEKAIQLNPKSPSAYINKGILLLSDLHQYVEALAAFEQAIHLDPNDADAQELKKIALAELKNQEDIIANIEQAISLDPNDADSYYFKGIFLSTLGRHEEAKKAYEQAVHINPYYSNFPYDKGIPVRDVERYAERLPKVQELS